MPTKIQGGLGIDKVQDGTVGISDVDTELYGKITALTTINLGEAKAASGTVVDFDVPEDVKRVTVMFDGVSTNGSSPPQLQIGDGAVRTTGYKGTNSVIVTTVASALMSSGFLIGVSTGNWSSPTTLNGSITLTLRGNNVWVCVGALGSDYSMVLWLLSGSKELSGVLDMVRLTTVNGTDQFDAGTINISWEF